MAFNVIENSLKHYLIFGLCAFERADNFVDQNRITKIEITDINWQKSTFIQ